MKIKTITAPNIHAALIEARRTLGDDVVLMESIPAQDGEPARITVMADASSRPNGAVTAVPDRLRTALPKNRTETVEPAQPMESASPSVLHRSAGGIEPAGYGYPKAGSSVAVSSEESARQSEGFSRENNSASTPPYRFEVGGRTLQDVASARESAQPGTSGIRSHQRGTAGSAGRGALFPNRNELVSGAALPVQHSAMDAIEKLMASQLQLLHDRLDTLERRFGGAIIGAAQAWIANPVYADLLNHGLRPASVTKIFDSLAQKGYRPDTEPEALKWAAAQEFRRSIDVSAPPQHGGAQVFIGPSGAGKTSLLLKLARHPGFFGRRSTTVILIEPEDGGTGFHHSAVDLFRMHGLPVQTVRTVDEMHKAVLRVQRFEHILIDTPALPLHPAAARKLLCHVKKLVDPIMPLRVQFVLNATRELEDFDENFIHGLALRPDMVAFTHLDEAVGWGRIAEWLMAVEMPVQFVSTGPSVPDGVVSFSPTWFIEEMMKL